MTQKQRGLWKSAKKSNTIFHDIHFNKRISHLVKLFLISQERYVVITFSLWPRNEMAGA